MKTDTVKLVTFRLGEDVFAADIASVERVLRYTPPSSVPDVPPWVEGVLEHRGTVIPVVDMRRRIGLANAGVTPETRVIVLVTADGLVGGIVDAVHEVAIVPAGSVAPPPALFRGLASQFLRGIAKVREQVVVRRQPPRGNLHVVIGEQQQRTPRHPDAGVLPAAQAGERFACGAEPGVTPAPLIHQGRCAIGRAVVDDDDLERHTALLRGERRQHIREIAGPVAA